MDHELIDGGRPGRARRASSGSGSDPAFDLPSRIGNAAFTALATSSLQRDAENSQGAGPLDPDVASRIDDARGAGSPLPDPVRSDMEGNLGADLSDVRLHTDARADGLSRAVQAEAFTTGTDVFFRSGRYDPDSSDGRGLLAHELTHVVQQGSGGVEGGRVSHPDDPHEVEAKAVGDAVAGAPAASTEPAAAVNREEAPEEDDGSEAGIARQEAPDEEEEDLPM